MVRLPVLFRFFGSFNSCMVQLKSGRHDPARRPFQGFNSCMVQLKSSFLSKSVDMSPRFNSCMVQLKYRYRRIATAY